jgi:hypothetical protein
VPNPSRLFFLFLVCLSVQWTRIQPLASKIDMNQAERKGRKPNRELWGRGSQHSTGGVSLSGAVARLPLQPRGAAAHIKACGSPLAALMTPRQQPLLLQGQCVANASLPRAEEGEIEMGGAAERHRPCSLGVRSFVFFLSLGVSFLCVSPLDWNNQ